MDRLAMFPPQMQANVRNQMYLTSESFRILAKSGPKMSDTDKKIIANYKGWLDKSTRFIPTWVKVAVALALGLGTMVGWKRIVVTVGEKIGKTHLTYAQGASAELVAMCTILARRYLRPARQYDPCALFRRRWHDGGEQERPPNVHPARHRPGLGLHLAGCGAALRRSLLALQLYGEVRADFCFVEVF